MQILFAFPIFVQLRRGQVTEPRNKADVKLFSNHIKIKIREEAASKPDIWKTAFVCYKYSFFNVKYFFLKSN